MILIILGIIYSCIMIGTAEADFYIMGKKEIDNDLKDQIAGIMASILIGIIWPITITSMIVRKLLKED